ncbi:hypothetical protein, partial [Paenibacillus kobensis]|uniref:hypothetical protein n=1 Tax=Paenibacillus kobensis TaxID=59841 RepID=UPI001C3FBC8D
GLLHCNDLSGSDNPRTTAIVSMNLPPEQREHNTKSEAKAAPREWGAAFSIIKCDGDDRRRGQNHAVEASAFAFVVGLLHCNDFSGSDNPRTTAIVSMNLPPEQREHLSFPSKYRQA